MRRITELRPTPAGVIALIALFSSLGGVSYGLAKNSVDGGEIKNNSVSSRDIRNSTIIGADVRNRSLRAGDFAAGQLPAGPQGPQGPQGPAGPAGQNGFGTLVYSEAFAQVSSGDPIDLFAPCPPGTFPTGGDVLVFDQMGTPDTSDDQLDHEIALTQGFAIGETGTPTGWFADSADLTDDRGVLVDAICANAQTVDTPGDGGDAGSDRLRDRR